MQVVMIYELKTKKQLLDAVNLKKSLEKKGIGAILFVPKNLIKDESVINEINIYAYPQPGKIKFLSKWFAMFLIQLKLKLKAKQGAIILTNTNLVRRNDKNVRYVAIIDENFISSKPSKPNKINKNTKKVFNNIDAVIYTSTDNKTKFNEREKFNFKNEFLIKPGIPIELLSNVAGKQLKITKIVGTILEENNYKDLENLLVSFRYLQNGCNFIVIPANGILELEQYKTLITNLNLGHKINIKHDISEQQKIDIIKDCDITLHLKRTYDIPNYALMSIALDVPVLVNSSSEIYKFKGLYYGNLDSPRTFAKKIKMILDSSEKVDRNYVAGNFNWDKKAAEYISTFKIIQKS